MTSKVTTERAARSRLDRDGADRDGAGRLMAGSRGASTGDKADIVQGEGDVSPVRTVLARGRHRQDG